MWQKRKSSHLLLALLLLAAACGGNKKPEMPRELTEFYAPIPGKVPYFKGADMNPYWANDTRSLPGDLRRLPQISLTDSEGKPLATSDLEGKYVLVSFFFSRCSGICPMVTANVKRVREQLSDRRDVVFLSITVDPDHDQPAELRQFRARNKVPFADWHFTTGSKAQIYELARSVFQADVTVRGTKDAADFLHTESVYLLDRNLYLRGIYRTRGLPDMARLNRELSQLRTEQL
jgi:protein SCO1/2